MVDYAKLILFICIFTMNDFSCGKEEFSVPFWIRRKRSYLLFPASTSLQLTLGVSATFDFIGQEKGQISYAFQHNAKLPSNYTEIINPPTFKVKRDVHVYHHFMEFLEGLNVNGTECVKKTICQLAQYPLDGDGILEEIINFFFTPSKHDFAPEDHFLHAESIGRTRGDCHSAFPHCRYTPLEYISNLQ